MDITNKTWRSGGVDIRSSGGLDDLGSGTDPAIGTTPTSGGTASSQGTATSSGSPVWSVSSGSNTLSSGTIQGSTPYNNQAIQNILSHIAALSGQSMSGFVNKKTNLFSIQFLGFDSFSDLSSTGCKNCEVLDEQALAMTAIGRSKSGWNAIDIAILDDVGNDVLNILNEQFNYQSTHSDTFDMIIEYYDDHGNTTATTYLYGCVIEEFASDPLNAANSSTTEMKIILTVQPRTITFA